MRLIRLPEVEAKIGLKRSTIYALAKEGKFPDRIKIGSNTSVWVEAQIDRWIQDRITAHAESSA